VDLIVRAVAMGGECLLRKLGDTFGLEDTYPLFSEIPLTTCRAIRVDTSTHCAGRRHDVRRDSSIRQQNPTNPACPVTLSGRVHRLLLNRKRHVHGHTHFDGPRCERPAAAIHFRPASLVEKRCVRHHVERPTGRSVLVNRQHLP
jgi:hypothetical protein